MWGDKSFMEDKKNWKEDTYKAFMDYLQDQFGK